MQYLHDKDVTWGKLVIVQYLQQNKRIGILPYDNIIEFLCDDITNNCKTGIFDNIE